LGGRATDVSAKAAAVAKRAMRFISILLLLERVTHVAGAALQRI
jgi:hypothetical protein